MAHLIDANHFRLGLDSCACCCPRIVTECCYNERPLPICLKATIAEFNQTWYLGGGVSEGGVAFWRSHVYQRRFLSTFQLLLECVCGEPDYGSEDSSCFGLGDCRWRLTLVGGGCVLTACAARTNCGQLVLDFTIPVVVPEGTGCTLSPWYDEIHVQVTAAQTSDWVEPCLCCCCPLVNSYGGGLRLQEITWDCGIDDAHSCVAAGTWSNVLLQQPGPQAPCEWFESGSAEEYLFLESYFPLGGCGPNLLLQITAGSAPGRCKAELFFIIPSFAFDEAEQLIDPDYYSARYMKDNLQREECLGDVPLSLPLVDSVCGSVSGAVTIGVP